MANLKAPMNIAPSGNAWIEQHAFGYFGTGNNGNTKIDIKTNINSFNTGIGVMHRIEAVGYAYGTGQPIRCSWAFHTEWNGTLQATSLQYVYPGLVPTEVYMSSDKYVCLRGNMASYYSGFILNATSANTGWAGTPIKMLAAVDHSLAGRIY